MTFCDFLNCCHTDCNRRITPDIYKNAEKCGLPICKFIEKPDCFCVEPSKKVDIAEQPETK